MVQEIKEGYEASAFTYGRHVFEETVTLDGTFKGILLIDSRKIRQSVIQFYNIGANPLDYKIFATAKYDPILLSAAIKDPSIINADDPQWINLLSIIAGQTGTNYSHTTLKTINSTLRFYESFSNQWFTVLVQAKSDVGTTCNIWHRGQS